MSTRDVPGSEVDRWARGREALRTADPRMAELIDADPRLDPDALFDSGRVTYGERWCFR